MSSQAYHLSISKFSLGVKRVFDVLIALLGLVFSLPLILVIVLAIFVEDHGSIIFRQERIGYKGRPFMLYKFRTMREDAERGGLPQLYRKGDDRLTKVGRFLRTHHLDEIPQFVNVLKGEMSLVGYRPERKFYVDKIIECNPNYVLLYQVRPGLFSNATLYNGYTDTMEKMLMRLDMDLAYMEKMSLWNDFVIILKTFLSIVSGKKF